ncbi:unnamed protein product [Arabidopsis halleri]
MPLSLYYTWTVGPEGLDLGPPVHGQRSDASVSAAAFSWRLAMRLCICGFVSVVGG